MSYYILLLNFINIYTFLFCIDIHKVCILFCFWLKLSLGVVNMKKILISIIFLICLTAIIPSHTVTAYADNNIVLQFGNNVWRYSLTDNIAYKNFEIESYKQFRANKIKNFSLREIKRNMLSCGYNEVDMINFLLPNFDKVLNDIKSTLEYEAIEPKITFNPNSKNMFIFSEGKNGRIVDTNALVNRILSGQKTVTIPCYETSPQFTNEELTQNTHLRSTQNTSFMGSESGRRHNLTMALLKFNGIVLMPNEKLSFNKTTGDRTYENGYKDAIVISNGEFVKGAGGGVCQASTTLYNSALMAGLKINKVYKHSLPVHYVEQGFDAMVNDDAVDMCFTNNTNYPIYIKTYIKSEHAYAEIYGEDMKGVSYKKVSEKIRDIQPEPAKIIPDTEGIYKDKIKYKGEYFTKRYAQNGLEVNAYLEKYLNGKLVRKDLIRHDVYKSQNAIIYEGVEINPNKESLNLKI